MRNQISWTWHIKIPYAYWDKRYPEKDYKNPGRTAAKDSGRNGRYRRKPDRYKERKQSHFHPLHDRKTTEGLKSSRINEPLDNKIQSDDKLVTSAAAKQRNPVFVDGQSECVGAGMPGGTYAGNQGGSNIREAFLVNIAMAWLDRQNLLDPIEAMLEFNGVKDIQLRFRNTILTTLDSGSGTTKNLA